MRKALCLMGLCLVLAFQCLSVVRASPSHYVFEPRTWTLPIVGPLVPVDGEPIGIPDSPFVERYGDKFMYLFMLTEVFCSSPESCNWNPAADLNRDGVVDICDAIIIAKNC